MTRYFALVASAVFFLSCQKDKKDNEEAKDTALAFTTAHYEGKTSRPCKGQCTYVDIDVPVAQNTPVVSDSINNKIFNTVRSIVYFGEKPTDAKTYEEVINSYIRSYDELVAKFPNEGLVPWEARIKGDVTYQSDKVLNIKLNNYMFTGGAHGYEGNRSLLFNPENGTSLEPADLFKDVSAFTKFAEKKFREKYKIAINKNINSTGLMFAEDKFILPQSIFFQKDGLLLYYNSYEAASYADGAKEVLIPFAEANEYLKIK
jgi:hypothetical protein